jgi:hypothetical protein
MAMPQGPIGDINKDWTCLLCGNVNFGSRQQCNRRSCKTPRALADPEFIEKEGRGGGYYRERSPLPRDYLRGPSAHQSCNQSYNQSYGGDFLRGNGHSDYNEPSSGGPSYDTDFMRVSSYADGLSYGAPPALNNGPASIGGGPGTIYASNPGRLEVDPFDEPKGFRAPPAFPEPLSEQTASAMDSYIEEKVRAYRAKLASSIAVPSPPQRQLYPPIKGTDHYARKPDPYYRSSGYTNPLIPGVKLQGRLGRERSPIDFPERRHRFDGHDVQLPDGRRMRFDPNGNMDVAWVCPSCSNDNFPFRDVCNLRRCRKPRPPATKTWPCRLCNAFNFPEAQICITPGCRGTRPRIPFPKPPQQRPHGRSPPPGKPNMDGKNGAKSGKDGSESKAGGETQAIAG